MSAVGSLVVTDRDGDERAVSAEPGLSVMEIIKENGFEDLEALCGGCCSCATCHVYVTSGHEAALPPLSADENDLLDSSDYRRANSRLSCQLKFSEELSGLAVTIAPEG
jgi:2Fe-2S ferredoxin